MDDFFSLPLTIIPNTTKSHAVDPVVATETNLVDAVHVEDVTPSSTATEPDVLETGADACASPTEDVENNAAPMVEEDDAPKEVETDLALEKTEQVIAGSQDGDNLRTEDVPIESDYPENVSNRETDAPLSQSDTNVAVDEPIVVIDDEIELNDTISIDSTKVQSFCDQHTSRELKNMCRGLQENTSGKKIELAQRILKARKNNPKIDDIVRLD